MNDLKKQAEPDLHLISDLGFSDQVETALIRGSLMGRIDRSID